MPRKRSIDKQRLVSKKLDVPDFTDVELWGDGTAENRGRAFECRDPKRRKAGNDVRDMKVIMLPYGFGKLIGSD
jgi:hypothetical protein